MQCFAHEYWWGVYVDWMLRGNRHLSDEIGQLTQLAGIRRIHHAFECSHPFSNRYVKGSPVDMSTMFSLTNVPTKHVLCRTTVF